MRRTAFTLIELTVVIAIIIVLAALTLAVAPRLRQDQKETRGAEQLQGWLFTAKQETYRDRMPRGVRIVRDANDPTLCRELLYIEQPEEFNGGPMVIPPNGPPMIPPAYPGGRGAGIQIPDPAFPGNYATARVTRAYPPPDVNVPLDLTNSVQAGDMLVFDTNPYTTHRIGSISFDGVTSHLTFTTGDGTPHPVPGEGNPAHGIGPGERGWHITRQMQPREGEANLKLPKDVVIDLSRSQLPGVGLVSSDAGDNFLDIVFSTKGGLLAVSSLNGAQVILWIRDSAKPFNPVGGTLIAINPRTGMIAAHPPAASADPFAFTRDGKNSGM